MARGSWVTPRALLGGLFAIILLLAAAGLLVVGVTYGDRLPERLNSATFIELFSLDAENNVPTWFSSTLLMACATLLAIIGLVTRRAKARHGVYWLSLAAIFVYLSIDEASSIHEHRGAPGVGDVGGVFFFEWVIPGIIAVVIVAAAFSRFVRDLPRRTGLLFVIAGGIYVFGALGFELIGGRHADRFGQDNATYGLITSFEEITEMLGLAVFLFALYWHLITRVRIRMELVSDAPTVEEPVSDASVAARGTDWPAGVQARPEVSPTWARDRH